MVTFAKEAGKKDGPGKPDKPDKPGQAKRGCDIGKVKFETGALNPVNECQSCQSAVNRSAWTDLEDGAACSDGVCFEAACCTPIAECGPAQCELVDDGCGGVIDCGSCLDAQDDRIEFTEPLNANGLTIYPLLPLDNDRIVDPDAAQIVSVTQAVINVCDQPVEFWDFRFTEPCWRQLGVISIDPGGKGLELNLNPGTAPQWNPPWPYFGKESAPAPSDTAITGGRSWRSEDCKVRKGTVEPDNVATTGTAANPALLCIASNEADVFLAKVPNPPGGERSQLCNVQPEPWDIPFEYTVSDGVHESTATVMLNMYTPGCQKLPSYAFDPNALLIQSVLHPPIVTNLVNHILIVPTQTDDTTLQETGPSITLDTSLAPIQLKDVVIEGHLTNGLAVSLPATCPEIAGVEFTSCNVNASFVIDPAAAAPVISDPTGAVVRLTEPLSVSTGPTDQRLFRSVVITNDECPECEFDFRTRHFAALFNIHGQCDRFIAGRKVAVWCDTGLPCEWSLETVQHYCRGGNFWGIPEEPQ